VLELSGDERGAVAVLVAVLILPLMLVLAFAVDTGNWWTHKRHLQTQADAGAFAGAQGPWFPVCDEAGIESAARQYAGNLGTGYNRQYTNSSNVHALLNSTAFYENGGSDFSDVGTPCYTLEQASAGNPAFLDVKAAELDLANIFGSIPGFSSVKVHTHARVEIQSVLQEDAVRPLAVRNDALYKCAHVQLWTTTGDGHFDSKLGSEFTSYSRTELADTSTQFQITGTATMPMKTDGNAPNVAVQVLLGSEDCAHTDAYADPDDSEIGVNFINVYKPDQTVGDGDGPALSSVSMPPGLSGCNPDPYFTVHGCTAAVKAYVKFAPGAVTSGSQNAFVWISSDGTNFVPAVAATDADGLYWTAGVPIGGESGPHPITVKWKQTYGTIPGPGKNPKDCSKGGGCEGSFDVAQQSFSATEDEDAVNSGKISLVQIADDNGLYANSLVQGTTHHFTITVRVRGLQNSLPTDPPTIIKTDVQRSKRTGLIDCGQGNGASADADAIRYGCPSGVYIWTEGSACVSPDSDPVDCVWPIGGERRQQIVRAIKDRITSTATGYGDSPYACSAGGSHWNFYRESGTFDLANFIDPTDPRLLPLIITSPADLSGNVNGNAIPVRAIATFYVTGYDGQSNSDNGEGCENEAYPASGSSKFKIWGHWIKYVPLGGGIGNGQWCDPSKFGDCIAVLTQ
jgi:Putative Flp pilus-assembly TadE/G-like